MLSRLYKALPAVWLFLSLLPEAMAHPDMPAVTDLRQAGALALERHLPIVLEFSASDCEYCKQLEEEFLRPMLLSGEYDDRMILRRLLVDRDAKITDFDGISRPAGAIAGRYRARVTPTLVFLDGKGNELAERITGINTPEMYGSYLDACIDTALLQLRDPHSTRTFAGCTAIRQR